MNRPSRKIETSVLDSSVEFLHSATEQLAGEPGERALKYAIIQLATGLELMLKYRLYLEHWTLVCQELSKAKRSQFDAGEFQSVNPGACVGRLINVCQITFQR
jgi:hypothetical protein